MIHPLIAGAIRNAINAALGLLLLSRPMIDQ
jgi:hypothetical protein